MTLLYFRARVFFYQFMVNTWSIALNDDGKNENKDFFYREGWLCIKPGCEDEGTGLFSTMHGRLKPQEGPDIQICVCFCVCVCDTDLKQMCSHITMHIIIF